jgi:hypothetical protein
MTLTLLPPIAQQTAAHPARKLTPRITQVRPVSGLTRTRGMRKKKWRSNPYQFVRFAHPVEAEFARVLTYYRVRWLYEPHQFALDWHPDGTVARMFSPDFYLPEFDLYAELTTQKQTLVTRKNAKLRRLRELHPEINIRLFYRKDLQRLLARFGIAVSSQTVTPPGGLAV